MNQPLAYQARDRIVEMILSGELGPGDTLSEGRLGLLLDMSRTPVREAMKRIEAEGLAAREGRFLKVRRLTCDEVCEIFLLRETLETHGARAAVGLSPAVLEAMRARIEALMLVGPGEEHWRIDDDFHHMIAAASGNPVLVSTVEALRLRTCMFDYGRVPDRFLKGCREHLGILDALRRGGGEEAAQLMGAHILRARNAILAHLEHYEERKGQ
ncbi:GntR family transcriptional regulator [Pararhizobium sp. LjRoot238]|uniref:GntR family transcriptional regulator n=1 Tax=Pararhizobium sp. LjRoot238 TaxID=3342293 RepID=UPI003ED08027